VPIVQTPRCCHWLVVFENGFIKTLFGVGRWSRAGWQTGCFDMEADGVMVVSASSEIAYMAYVRSEVSWLFRAAFGRLQIVDVESDVLRPLQLPCFPEVE